MRKIKWPLMLAIIFMLPCIALAVPQLINYQGKLTDSSGNPINDNVSITFTIYNDATGGFSIWYDTQTVAVTNGVFSVLLGFSNGIANDIFHGEDKYLGVRVGSDPEMVPRQRITSIAYAFRSENADSADSFGGYAIGELIKELDKRYVSAPDVSTVDPGSNTGRYTSIAIGMDGNPVISYQDYTGSSLNVAKCGDAICSSAGGYTISTIEVGDEYMGLYTSIAIGTDGNPVIAYYYSMGLNVKVAKCGDALCSSVGGYTITALDSAHGYTSIAIGTDGNPVIAFSDFLRRLKVAKCGNPACSSGNTITIVDAVGDAGLHISITIGTDGNPIISYLDLANGLKVAKCSDAACTSATKSIVDSVASWYTSIAIGRTAIPLFLIMMPGI
jgi:hypothetical protein